MALDPRIILSGRNQGGLSQALEAGREDKRQRQLFELAKQDRDRGIKLEDEDRAAARTREQQAAQAEANRKNLESIAVGAVEIQPLLESTEGLPTAVSRLNRRIEEIEARGGDASDTREVLGMIESGRIDQARLAVDSAIKAGAAQGIIEIDKNTGLPATVLARQDLIGGFSPEDQQRARRIEAGLDPRAGSSSTERIAGSPELTERVATSKAAIEGSVADASAVSKAKAEQAERERANKRTLEVWEAGRAGLIKALEGTETGPVAGNVPAVTAAQQTAEGAIAAVAPVLKQLFRSAGEGIFTDKDQQLLLDMVPKRTDHPEARDAKMEMIDSIIKAKLGSGELDDDEARLKALGY